MVRRLETMSDWLGVGTDAELDILGDYLKTLIIQLDTMADDFDRRVQAEAQKIQDPVQRNQFYEWSGEEYWNYKENFPRILLNSFLVTAYSLLESELNSIAGRIGRKQKQPFEVSDIKGKNYLQSACLYINKLTKVDCKKFQSWNEITEAQRLRNIIAHSNGRVTEPTDIRLATKLKVLNTSHVLLTSGRTIHEISVTHQYASAFLNAMRGFFTELYKATKDGDLL